MANALYCENEVVEMNTGGTKDEATEWVRGNDTALVARFAPLVREQSVVLDFSGVERIDAAGLAALISLYRESCGAGHTFAVTSPTPHVKEILAVVGLDRVLLVEGGATRPVFNPCLARSAA